MKKFDTITNQRLRIIDLGKLSNQIQNSRDGERESYTAFVDLEVERPKPKTRNPYLLELEMPKSFQFF
jgi:hypothetical protein